MSDVATQPLYARLGRLLLRARRWWLGAAIAFIYLYSFPYFEARYSADELPHIYLAMAMAERGSLAIDDEIRSFQLTVGTSTYNGQTYSSHAPGMSLLLVPVYAVMKLCSGGKPPPLARLFFWLRLFGAAIPSLLFVLFLSRCLDSDDRDRATRRLLVLGYAVGSMALVYGTLLLSHHLAGALLGTSFFLIRGIDLRPGRGGRVTAALSGLAAGAAALVDYTAVFVSPVLLVYLLVRARDWTYGQVAAAIAFCLAAAVPVAVLLTYHWLCFESPFTTGMHHVTDPAMRNWLNSELFGLGGFSLAHLGQQLVSPRSGIFYYSPFLLLAGPGLVLMITRQGHIAEAVVCGFVIAVSYVLAGSLSHSQVGWSVGSRYLAYTVPFYVVPVAATVEAVRSRAIALGPAVGLVAAAMVTFTALAAVFPYYPDGFSDPFFNITARFGLAGYLPYNLGWLLGLSGLASVVPYLLVVGALLLALLCSFGPGVARRMIVAVGALSVTAAILTGYYSLLCHRVPPPASSIDSISTTWQPRYRGLDGARLHRTIAPSAGFCQNAPGCGQASPQSPAQE